jgi:hypothetical protein
MALCGIVRRPLSKVIALVVQLCEVCFTMRSPVFEGVVVLCVTEAKPRGGPRKLTGQSMQREQVFGQILYAGGIKTAGPPHASVRFQMLVHVGGQFVKGCSAKVDPAAFPTASCDAGQVKACHESVFFELRL